nr:MAG TPA_asm: hypothetical protein [Caudoviricetes sp.]
MFERYRIKYYVGCCRIQHPIFESIKFKVHTNSIKSN